MEKKSPLRKPEWLNRKINISKHSEMLNILNSKGSLNTICREAMCPNISECFEKRQASFLVMGSICTRRCTFCNVDKSRKPEALDLNEPENLARTIEKLKLGHVVITSPTRDDLEDEGAGFFAQCVEKIREINPNTRIELLIPDFSAKYDLIKTVMDSNPYILAHNLETVPSKYEVRKGSDYKRSLKTLQIAKEINSSIPTKSGLMLGLGETENELIKVFNDLVNIGCDYLSLGQYLAPSKKHYPVAEYISPGKFEAYRRIAMNTGFKHVESGPYVRSSYNADKYNLDNK